MAASPFGYVGHHAATGAEPALRVMVSAQWSVGAAGRPVAGDPVGRPCPKPVMGMRSAS